MHEPETAGQNNDDLPGAKSSRPPATRPLSDSETSWKRYKIAAIGISAIASLIWLSEFTYGRSHPSPEEMHFHLSELSEPCQKVAGEMLKTRLLQKQKSMTNQEVEAVVDNINQKRCVEVNSQIDMINNTIAPTILIAQDL